MKKVLVLVILNLSLFGFTSVKELKFESGISIYGQVGFADVVLEQNFDDKTYKMSAVASSTGIVKALSGNREDSFTSEGIISDGVYTPTKFVKRSVKTDYEKVTTYYFDYIDNKVKKEKVIKRYEIISNFDPYEFKFIESKKLVVESSSEEIGLYANDFLTLYLNLKHGNLEVGDVKYIDKDDEDSVSLLNQGIFEIQKDSGKENYKIILSDDKNSIFFKKAVAENIAFYGDAYIKKIYEKNIILN